MKGIEEILENKEEDIENKMRLFIIDEICTGTLENILYDKYDYEINLNSCISILKKIKKLSEKSCIDFYKNDIDALLIDKLSKKILDNI